MRGLLDRVRRPVNGGARASSRGELLARLARAALWTAIAIALIRGLGRARWRAAGVER